MEIRLSSPSRPSGRKAKKALISQSLFSNQRSDITTRGTLSTRIQTSNPLTLPVTLILASCSSIGFIVMTLSFKPVAERCQASPLRFTQRMPLMPFRRLDPSN